MSKRKQTSKRKTPTEASRFISIWVKNSLVKELKKQAGSENRSVNALITHIIKSYLKYCDGVTQQVVSVENVTGSIEVMQSEAPDVRIATKELNVKRDEDRGEITLQSDSATSDAKSDLDNSPVPNPFASWPEEVA